MNTDHIKSAADVGAVAVWLASMAQWLPAVASMLSILWILLRIIESRTVQHFLGAYAWIKEEDRRED